MPSTNSPITWSQLITETKAKLRENIENIDAQIPQELQSSSELVISTRQGKNRDIGNYTMTSKARPTSNRTWRTVTWAEIEEDFDNFLTYFKLNNRADQYISTRLILNFFENLALFYNNRLIFACSSFGSQPRKLYYYNDGSSYDSWAGQVGSIEVPVEDVPASAEDVSLALDNLDANLKNKIKTFTQTYDYYITCSSCSSSSSSCSSSSSSCCSCLTIVHQDLSML